MPRGTAWFALTGLLVAILAFAATATADEPSLSPLTSADEEPVPAEVPVGVGWVLTTADGEPAFHQDARFEVTFEGETLLAVPPASGHDYDGVDPYQVAFPGPGNFTVTAQVHDDGEVRRLVHEGTVGPAPERSVGVAIEAPEATTTGRLTGLTVTVEDEQGEPVDAGEVTVRVQRAEDRFEVLTTRLTVDAGSASLSHAFDRAGTFLVTAVAAPLPGEASFRAATATHTIEIDQGPPSGGAPVEQPLLNEREAGSSGDGYELFGTYDPYTSVGPHGRVRLGMLTLDSTTHEPVPDVAYRASILDPHGDLVFQASHLEGSDGFAHVTVSRAEPGTYTMRVDAVKDGWRDHVVMEFTVLPPAGATNAGPLMVSPNASTSLAVGSASTFPIYVEDAAGVPLMHGEVDVRFLDAETGVPTVTGKLHVHENGTLPVTLAPIHAGEHELQLLPQSLQPAPTPRTYGEAVGQPPTFAMDVDAADLVEDASPSSVDGDEPAAVDGAGLVGVAVGLLAASTLTARRWR